MKSRLILPYIGLALFTGWPLSAQNLQQHTFEGIDYQMFTTSPASIELHWKSPTGKPYRQFVALQQALQTEGKEIVFIMNAGIFEPQGIPSGLHVENNQLLRPLNLQEGKGNFYLKPNGVFRVAEGKAQILESSEYANLKEVPRIALQSGPLLLHSGKIHPKFTKKSKNRLHRNGVGILPSGKVVFAMTHFSPDNKVNLHGFARLFASLGCKEALFLDGDLSMMATPSKGESIKLGNSFGALLCVTRTGDQAQ